MPVRFSIDAELALLGVSTSELGAEFTQGVSVPLQESATVEPLEEKKQLRGGKLVKVQKHTSGERAKWRRAAHKSKAKRAKTAAKPAAKKKSKKRMKLRKKLHLDAVQPVPSQASTALSEAEAVLQAHKLETRDLDAKGFAELALNADLLGRAFRVLGTAMESADLLGLAEDYDKVAETANSKVEELIALQENDLDLDGVVIKAQFDALAAVVIDGTELYEVIGEELAKSAAA